MKSGKNPRRPKTLSTIIVNKTDFHRTVTRLAYEIVEKNKGAKNIALIGIRTRGEFLAKRLAEKIAAIEKHPINTGFLDITFYRDDLQGKLNQPVFKGSEIPFDVTGKNIILVDDVLYTGRTIRAALGELVDMGRPDSIQLAVLIDRGHREMPITANFVGKIVATGLDQEIKVKMNEIDKEDAVLLVSTKKEK
ncbi:MAG: bifunctional pyr operon transcriptional regulator/uracil phosphoribosyltransferase PyrR [Bacteroidota bacterium]